MTQDDRERLAALEMQVWRRMEKNSWLDKVTKEVLQKVGGLIKKQFSNYSGKEVESIRGLRACYQFHFCVL